MVLWGEIVLGILAGLFIVPFGISTIRALIGGQVEAWAPSLVLKYEARAAKERWPHRCLVALDIFCNVVLLRGQQDETISTHCYRALMEGKLWGKVMSRWLCWFQPNHGQKAASGDLERATARVLTLKKVLGVS